MYQLAVTPISIGSVFAESFKLYREVFWRVLGISVLINLIITLPSFFVRELNSTDAQVVLNYLSNTSVSMFGYLVFLLFGYSVLLHRVKLYAVNHEYNLAETLKTCLKKLPYLILGSLLALVIVLAGYALFIVPGIILQIVFSFYIPILLLERSNSVFEALSYNFDLVFHQAWRVAIYVVAMILIGLGVLFILNHIGNLWTIEHPQLGKILAGYHVLRFLFLVFHFPFLVCTMIVMLNDLKARRRHKIAQESAS